MRRMKVAICGTGVALAGLLAAPASATVLTFEIDDQPIEQAIDPAYGDNVTGDSGNFHYLEGNGWTPNIAVEYATLNQDQSVYLGELRYYDNGYSSPDVAYPVNDGLIAEITLDPEAGYAVRINSFDLAAFGGAYEVDLIRIADENGVPLWSSSESAIGPTTETFFPAFTGAPGQTLRLQFGSTYNVAFDNINFDQVIPEPASAMLLLGLAPLVARRRRA